MARDRSCFSHLMPTHGSWVHVIYLKNVATILLHSGISTAYTVVKVVFGVGREYDNFRSRSLQQPIVIITPRSFKNNFSFKIRIKYLFQNHINTISFPFKTQINMISFLFQIYFFSKIIIFSNIYILNPIALKQNF